MITTSDTVRGILDSGSGFTYAVAAQSWQGDQLLADDVPIADGQETSDRSSRVPEYVTLTVPRFAGGTDWLPTAQDSPLAACGQTLTISLGIGTGPDGIEWFQRGVFLISDTTPSDDGQTLTVIAVGLLALIDEAEFVSPYQPTGTIVSTLRNLVEPAVTVDVDDAPGDRSVPVAAVNWDSDRLQAVYDLLDAWPATPRVDELGVLVCEPVTIPAVGDAVRSFTDGAGGTVVSAAGSSSRDGGFNTVVATGYAADGTEVRGVAYLASGAWRYGGEANPLPVPFGYNSPLLTTTAQCQAAARTVLARKAREAALQAYTVTAVPDPTIQLGDPVLVDVGAAAGVLCTVETIALPYTASDATMTLKVVSVS